MYSPDGAHLREFNKKPKLAFDETKENWKNEYSELKELLTPEEYEAARESTLTAFYTVSYGSQSCQWFFREYRALDGSE